MNKKFNEDEIFSIINQPISPNSKTRMEIFVPKDMTLDEYMEEVCKPDTIKKTA